MNHELHRTRFVIMAGLPGTGKTLLAKALAARLGGLVLSKDEVRARLFAPGEIEYSSAQNDYCMSLILKEAQQIAWERSQPFVFLDGRTFSRTAQIQQVLAAAAEAGAEVRILHLDCPEDVALQRIRRDQGKHLAGNRDATLYSRIKPQFEPIRLPKLDVDTSRPVEECVADCVRYLAVEDA